MLGELVCGLGGVDSVQGEMDQAKFKTPSLAMVVASPIYRGPGPLPKYLRGKGANNGQFERGQLVQLILTKVVFACQRLWW